MFHIALFLVLPVILIAALLMSFIDFLLWLPFILTIMISGIIFCIAGYKKGLWRALISFGATLVSAIISYFAANLISSPIASVIFGLLPLEDFLDMPILFPLINGIISSVISIILFAVFMFIITIIAKIIASRVKKDALITKERSKKLCGLAVRAVDAMVFTMLLLIPLYGTIASYIPTVTTLMSYSDDSGSEIVLMYLEGISDHPIVNMAKPAPISAVYDGLSSFKLQGTDVSLSKISKTVDETMSFFDNVLEKSPEEISEQGVVVINQFEENVINQDWFYAIAQEGFSVASEMAESTDGAEEMGILLDMPKEDFQANCSAILDVAEYVFEEGIFTEAVQQLESDEPDLSFIYSSGLDEKLGELLNSTEQMVMLKSFLLTETDGELPESLASLSSDEPITDPELQKEFGKAILNVLIGD